MRRISCDIVDKSDGAPHQPASGGGIGGITAAEPVLAQRPDVAGSGDGFGGRVRDRIRRAFGNRRAVVGVSQQCV